MPSADFADAYSCRRVSIMSKSKSNMSKHVEEMLTHVTHVEEPIRDRVTTPLFTFCILLHSWIHTIMAASSIMSLLKR